MAIDLNITKLLLTDEKKQKKFDHENKLKFDHYVSPSLFLKIWTTLIRTVHTKQARSQARKGTLGNSGSYKPTVENRVL